MGWGAAQTGGGLASAGDGPVPGGPAGPRLGPRLEHQYGPGALADWFAEVLVEAGRGEPESLAS